MAAVHSPICLSLFSGAGGLDIGLEQAGFQLLAQIEMDPDCSSTLLARSEVRGPRPLVIQKRIEDVDPARLLAQLKVLPGELDLLAGGPPCQPFTTTGLRKGINDRRASSTFPRYLEYVSTLKPKAVVLENVDGFLSAALRHRPLSKRGRRHPPLSWEESKGSFLHWFLAELAGLGYSVAWGVLDSVGHGVAQFRQRAFLVGVVGEEPCFLPEETFGPGKGRPWRNLREALAEVNDLGPIQPLSERKRKVFERIPEGGNWRDLPIELQEQTMGAAYHATGGKSGWWRRLSWDSPAPTVLGMPDHSSTALIHPDEDRCLSLNECAAIQSFPTGTYFSGTSRSRYQQVGNAVPPRLGKAIGQHLMKFFSGERAPKAPPAPGWRRESANRRIGTHGWVTPKRAGIDFSVVAKARPDSVWAKEGGQLELS